MNVENKCIICGNTSKGKTCSPKCLSILRKKPKPKPILYDKAKEITEKLGYKLISYKSSSVIATFEDPIYGQFQHIPNNVWYHGYGHPDSKNERRNKTCLKKYGTSHHNQSQTCQDKIKKTLKERYNCENIAYIGGVQEQKKQTNLNKYGVENVGVLAIKTNLEKYGVQFPFQSSVIRQKAINTNIKKYGVKNPSSLKSVQEKKIKNCLDKYGVPYHFQRHDVKQKILKTIQQKIDNGEWTNRFGKTQEIIKRWLQFITKKQWNSNRTMLDGKEIDLFNDELKIGIEYCGLIWHSEKFQKDNAYHYKKMKLCEKKGIRLITIFEDEWLNNNQQVRNFLKSVLNIHNINIYARNTLFKEISKSEARVFLDENHIQGSANLSKYFYGLFYGDLLVSVMTFGSHHRQGNKDKVVLDRFAVKSNYSIVGGASKLFKNALKLLPRGEIISWSDNRWSQGNVYGKLGFTLVEEYRQDYSYVKSHIQRLSKQSQMKVNTGCPSNITEKEWALKDGLYRIWDCGKKKWLYINK